MSVARPLISIRTLLRSSTVTRNVPFLLNDFVSPPASEALKSTLPSDSCTIFTRLVAMPGRSERRHLGSLDVGHRLERHDQRQGEVQQDAEPAREEDREEPEDPHEAHIESEELSQTGRDTRDPSVVTAAVEVVVHLHPPIGVISRVPRWTSPVTSTQW